jgi:uncharacterized membrane protein
MGENHVATVPTMAYGVVLLMAALAYFLLQNVIVAAGGPESTLKEALGSDVKGKASPVIYAIAIVVALVAPAVSVTLYVLVAAMWLVPDRRIERRLAAG